MSTVYLEKPAPTATQLERAAKYRAEAKAADDRAEESFQRSDTDGFLSQWANGMTSRLAETKAKILEDGGCIMQTRLFHGDRIVDAKCIDTKFGVAWLLSDAEANEFGRRFIPVKGYQKKTSRIQTQLGLSEKYVWVPGWAKIGGSGTGLSGCASAHVDTFPTKTMVVE